MYRKINISKRVAGSVCLAFFVLAIVACAGWKVSPEHTYLKALKHFNNTVEIYEKNYQAQTPETQEKWKERIDPLIKTASEALDIWHSAIGSSQAQLDYQKALSTLIQAMFDIGIVEVKEN